MRRLHFALGMTPLAITLASSLVATPAVADDDWTVLTMAPDGSWGAATNPTINRAIASAIANCKIEYQREIGCGAYFTSIQAGWSLGFRCGRETIVVAHKTLAGAEQAATRREAELRLLYVPNMPPCQRVVTVDPNGAIVVPHSENRVTVRDPSLYRQFPLSPKWITLGSYQDIDVLRDALGQARVRTGVHTDAILKSREFSLSTNETEINLVIASVADLGFSNEGATLPAIYARARTLGLELCPAEVGPLLRLRYLKQPVGEWLRIAMTPIVTNEGIAADFTVANGGTGPMLLGGEVRADSIMPTVIRFVFTRRQPPRAVVGR